MSFSFVRFVGVSEDDDLPPGGGVVRCVRGRSQGRFRSARNRVVSVEEERSRDRSTVTVVRWQCIHSRIERQVSLIVAE